MAFVIVAACCIVEDGVTRTKSVAVQVLTKRHHEWRFLPKNTQGVVRNFLSLLIVRRHVRIDVPERLGDDTTLLSLSKKPNLTDGVDEIRQWTLREVCDDTVK
jgi:hypothetical protein